MTRATGSKFSTSAIMIALLLFCACDAAVAAFGRGGTFGRTGGSESVCGEWVHVSSYGQGAVSNYVYEFEVSLTCNAAQRLSILAADSVTVVTEYFVFDWTATPLRGLLRRSVSADTRDSVYVMRTASGTVPSMSAVVLAGSDFGSDYSPEKQVTASNWATATRFALDTTSHVPMFDTTGTGMLRFREPSPILYNPDDTDADRRCLWMGSGTSTVAYDADSSKLLLYASAIPTSGWTFEQVIPGIYGEDPYLFWYGDSLFCQFEDKARGSDTDQVSIISSADFGLTWTGKTVCVGPSAGNVEEFKVSGSAGRKSPSSPTTLVVNDSVFTFVEWKANQYTFDGNTVLLSEGAVYLYRAATPRGPYTRVVNPATNTAGGDTLVPFFPLQICAEGDTIYSIGGIPHDVHRFGSEYVVWFSGVGHTTSGCSVQRSNQWPVVMRTSGSLWDAAGYSMFAQASGNGAYDSLYSVGLGLPQDLAEVGPYMLAETSADATKIYLTCGQVFDSTANPYPGWQYVRATGADYLPSHVIDNGVLSLMGEQLSKNSAGFQLQTGLAALGDSFEVVARMRIPSRGAGGYALLSVGSGGVTDRTDDGSTWEEAVLESGTTVKLGATTSTLYKVPASGTALALENNTMPSPSSYTAWHEFRLANRKTADWQGSHRWTWKWDSVATRWFVRNANGTAADWIGNSNKILVSGGASSAYAVANPVEVDYLYARPALDVDLFSAAGTVYRDSIAVTADAYIYQNLVTTNYGSTNPVHCGWTNGGGSTRASALFYAPLTAIPDTHQILYAVLMLADTLRYTSTGDSTGYYGLYRVTADWVQGTANGAYQNGSCSWNNQGFGTGVGGTTIAQADSAWATAGGDFAPVHTEVLTAVGSTPAQYAGFAFDGTEFVRHWKRYAGTNFGVMVRETRSSQPNKTINQRFQSKEDGETSDRPYWLIWHAAAAADQFVIGTGAGRAGRGAHGRFGRN